MVGMQGMQMQGRVPVPSSAAPPPGLGMGGGQEKGQGQGQGQPPSPRLSEAHSSTSSSVGSRSVRSAGVGQVEITLPPLIDLIGGEERSQGVQGQRVQGHSAYSDTNLSKEGGMGDSDKARPDKGKQLSIAQFFKPSQKKV